MLGEFTVEGGKGLILKEYEEIVKFLSTIYNVYTI